MGYDLYITRAPSWLETEEYPISESEWKVVVAADPSLSVSEDFWFERSKGESVERIKAVIWDGHPERVPFWFYDGAISAKNPDDETIEKMVEIAEKLRAHVLGEEDEEHLGGGQVRQP
ncbi:MAG TPA: hypothetical protein VEY11_06915 [Pyrinomonadaceae bacterium]|nr:hypothetical protein [Pyrinomonadaceae bacterium]